MDKNERTAILLALSDQLKHDGSWCGETHVQKTMYVMQEMLGVPTAINFILYKHGPFSFDLQDELSELRGDELLTVVPTGYQYGSSLKPTELGMRVKNNKKEFLNSYQSQIQFVSKKLGNLKVADLEKIATALYVTKELGSDITVEERASKLVQYKPHIKCEDAVQAVKNVDALFNESQKIQLIGNCVRR